MMLAISESVSAKDLCMSWKDGQLIASLIQAGHRRLTSLWDSGNAYEPMSPMIVL